MFDANFIFLARNPIELIKSPNGRHEIMRKSSVDGSDKVTLVRMDSVSILCTLLLLLGP